jgi:hypothetical protein
VVQQNGEKREKARWEERRERGEAQGKKEDLQERLFKSRIERRNSASQDDKINRMINEEAVPLVNQPDAQPLSEVNEVTICNVQQEGPYETMEGSLTVGHKFTLRVRGRNPARCQLRWYEKTDVSYLPGGNFPTEGEYMKENVWNNMYRIHPESNVFTPWREALKDGGEFTIDICDPPGIVYNPHESKARQLRFRLIVESQEGSERVAEAEQYIRVENGVLKEAHFKVYKNNVQVSNGGYAANDQPPPYIT